MKKLTALILSLVLLSTLVPALASEDVTTIKFWHIRGAGAQYECVEQAVNSFNETVGKEKGIVVEENFIGNYIELFAQIQLAVQAGESPNVVGTAGTYTPYMLEDDMIVNMALLAEAEGYDLIGNQLACLLEIGGNTDGDLYSVGYCRSTPLFFYNKDIAREVGIEFGDIVTVDELVKWGEAVVKKDENGKTTRYAYQEFNEFGYYQVSHVYQMGSAYLAEDGSGSPCLEDGTMLKILSDWRSWVDAGWCRPFDATNASDTARALFASGELAAISSSCAGLSRFHEIADESGFELGVSMYPTYDADNHIATIGGANLCIIGAENSEEEIQASWEFIKHVLADEQTFFNTTTSGYVPSTNSITEYEPMVEFWAEKPSFKLAYDQMLEYGHCEELPALPFAQDFTQMIWDACSKLIGEQSITAEEAIEQIRADAESLWI